MAAAASPDDEVARTLTIRRRLAISGLLVLLLFALNLGVTLWSAARRDHALADLHQTSHDARCSTPSSETWSPARAKRR